MRFGIREIVFVLILLAIPAAWYFTVAQPRLEKKSQRTASIQKVESQIKSVTASTAEFEDVEAQIQKLNDAMAHFQSMLPTQKDEEDVLRTVWELAGEHELTATSIKPDKPVATAQYAELPIQMQITGDFDGLYDFIRDIEKLPRITRMPKIKINRVDKVEHTGTVKAALTLSVFFEGDQAARS
ncbi:MAG: type 4a pilus biogenesis protein PilO [Planctomycetota bacterium]